MHFLLNDVVFKVTAEDLANSRIGYRFAAIDFDFVQMLGQELFAEHPLVHRTHPERAIKLAALILFKAPSINAALFVAPSENCRPRDVAVRYASLDLPVIAALSALQTREALTPTIADRQVWRRMAA
ncbi:MAG TPA: hypothetical protein VMU59_13750 [Caulobacteraceae bacterium]|nr:hypothetical protein [Caulobacteraceae bacterium]